VIGDEPANTNYDPYAPGDGRLAEVSCRVK